MSLMATSLSLLETFSHSSALKRVDEWLGKAAATDGNPRTMKLLELLKKMPMSISSLQGSGVGKTVNKLRKAKDSVVQEAAAVLLKEWKAVAAGPSSSQPASAPTLSCVPQNRVKRAAPDSAVAAAPAKKFATFDNDNDLDSLSAPRKASLKPDFIKPRRPVKPMSIKLMGGVAAVSTKPSLSAAPKPPPAASSTVADDGIRVVPLDPPPSSATPKIADKLKLARDSTLSFDMTAPRRGRRVTWAPAKALVEERTYVCEVKAKGDTEGATDFRGQMHAELEAEKLAQIQVVQAPRST